MARIYPFRRYLALVAAAAWLAAAPALAQDFVPGIDDLPLMPGLAADAEASVLFDTAAGRIVESTATGRVAGSEVAAFYRATLPQLGWTEKEALAFHRAGERLVLEIAPADGGGVAVKFALAPDPEKDR